MAKWQQRAVGIAEIMVPADRRQQGYAQTLLVETCRRLRDELVMLAEMHVPESNNAGRHLAESAGFEVVDTGVVYRQAT